MRRCPQCDLSFEADGFYSDSQTYCILCTRYNNITKYKATRHAYYKRTKGVVLKEMAVQYEEKKKAIAAPISYRVPRAPILHVEVPKPVEWSVGFD